MWQIIIYWLGQVRTDLRRDSTVPIGASEKIWAGQCDRPIGGMPYRESHSVRALKPRQQTPFAVMASEVSRADGTDAHDHLTEKVNLSFSMMGFL
jgi:hypothetical protein